MTPGQGHWERVCLSASLDMCKARGWARRRTRVADADYIQCAVDLSAGFILTFEPLVGLGLCGPFSPQLLC